MSARPEPLSEPSARDPLDILIEGLRRPQFSAIREAIEVLGRLPASETGYTTGRPQDFRRITEALDDFLKNQRRLFLTQDPASTGIFFELIEKLGSSQIRLYPNEMVQLDLVRAEALLAIGKAEIALRLLEPISRRPYLIEGDFASLLKLFRLDTIARLNLGKIEGLSDMAFARLRLLIRWRPSQSPELLDAMAPALALGSAPGSRRSLAQSALRALARICLRETYTGARSPPERIAFRFASGSALLIGSLILVAVRFGRGRLALQPTLTPANHDEASGASRELETAAPEVALPSIEANFSAPGWRRKSSTQQHDVLVTRAMGGLGDIMMMTPGLHSLAQKLRRPVHFATKRQFFPIVENNPDLVLIDIDSDIDLAAYQRWWNLSVCPAAAYEAKVRPDVRKGRVELFAGGMGIDERQLKRSGLRPRLTLSFAQAGLRDQARARLQARNRPVVGIQPYSRDTYKNYPSMLALAAKLADDYTLVVLHNVPVPMTERESIIMATDLNLRHSIAMVAACDYFISVDSAFYHVAAALDIPALGIFGPTSGKTFSKHHPRHRLISPPVHFPCSPCWRNEDIPCYLTATKESACLSSITVASIISELRELEHAYPTQGLGRP